MIFLPHLRGREKITTIVHRKYHSDDFVFKIITISELFEPDISKTVAYFQNQSESITKGYQNYLRNKTSNIWRKVELWLTSYGTIFHSNVHQWSA